MSTQLLHQGLVEDGLYSGTVQQFQQQYSSKESQQELYNGIVGDGDFSGSFLDFQNKFFPTQAAKTTSYKPYVAPVTKTKEKSEKTLQIEQDAIDPEFWKDYTYTNPGVDEVGYNESYSTGEEIPLSREQYEKRINPETNKEQWVWVNPSNPNDIDYTLDERTTEELNREEVAIGNASGIDGDTYQDVEDEEYDQKKKEYIDSYVASEYVYDEEGSFISNMLNRQKKQLEAIRSFSQSELYDPEFEEKRRDRENEEKRKDPNYIISDEEEAEILGSEGPLVQQESVYGNFIEKYGSASTSEKKWTTFGDENVIKLGATRGNYSYHEQNLGPLTKTTKTWMNVKGHDKEEISYKNNQTGEELTKEETKEFEKFSYMKTWDDFVSEKMTGLGENDRLLLRKNPELFKFNSNYRSADVVKESDKVFDFGDDLTTEKEDVIKSTPTEGQSGTLFQDFKESKATETYEDPFYFYDKDEYKIKPLHQTILEDKFGEYYLEQTGQFKGHKRYLKWHPNTPKSVIEEYEELKKRVDDNQKGIYSEVVYGNVSGGGRKGGTADFISNEWDDSKEFRQWWDDNSEDVIMTYSPYDYNKGSKEVFKSGTREIWIKPYKEQTGLDGKGRPVYTSRPGRYKTITVYKDKKGREWNGQVTYGSKKIGGNIYEITDKSHSGKKSNDYWNSFRQTSLLSIRNQWKNTSKYKELDAAWKEGTVELKKEEEALKKETNKFLKGKWKKYHIDDYIHNVGTYEEDNNISFATDFDKEIQEINAEAQAYFETESLPIQEEIGEELNSEFQNRYIRNEDNELIDTKTNKVVTQEDLNKNYQNEFQKRFSSHPDIIRLKRENNALFHNTAEKFRENWKPKRELISQDWYDEIGDKLSNMGFSNKIVSEQRATLDNIWDSVERKLTTDFFEEGGDQNELIDYLTQRKHEYYNYFYDPDKYNLAYNAKGEYSRFAIGQLAHIKEMFAEDKLLDRGRELEAGEGIFADWAVVTGRTDADARKELEDIRHLIETTDKKAEDLDGFIEGFTSLRTEDWFIPALLDKTIDTYKIGKKMEEEGWEGLTEAEKSHMTMINLQGMIDGRNRELSTNWYGAGKLTAEMIPYVAEFVLTSGFFTGARALALKGLTTQVVKRGGSVATSAATKNAVKFSSWMFGTLAHTTANPQRYINATLENMTPEMQLMMSDEGDELVGIISENGMGFEEAFLKGFGTTWAEFGTERLGEAIPMLGKYMRGKLPEGGKEFFERFLISKYIKKRGWTRLEAIREFGKQKIGFHGLIGEVFEETVNQPLSNIIMGNDVLEGMDSRFFSELSLSMGVTQVVFGGLSLATMKKGRKTGYSINNTKYRNEAEFEAALKKMDAQGLLGSNTKIDIVINNDQALADRIEKQYLSKHKNKRNSMSNTQTSMFDQILASEIDITNELGENVKAYEEVSLHEAETSELMEIKRDINNNSTLSTEERKSQLKDINLRLKYLHQSKNQILAPIKNKIQKRKRLEAYKSTTAKVRRLIKKLGFDTEIKELATLEQTKKAAKADLEREMAENQEVLDNYKGDKRKKEYKDLLSTQQEIQEDYAEDNFVKQIDEVTHGYISRDGKTIVVNKAGALAKKGGNINVAAHEFLHRALRNMIAQNPATQIALGRSLQKYIMNIDPNYAGSKYRQRLLDYQGNVAQLNSLMESYSQAVEAGDTKAAQEIASEYHRVENTLDNIPAEEAITLLSDAFASGDISMSNRRLSGLGKIFERIMSAFGVKATFEEGGNVFDFIANFNESLEKDNFSRGMIKTLKEEAVIKGELKEDVEGYAAALKGQARAQAKAQFSKGIGKTGQELGGAANTAKIIAKNEKLQQEILDRYERGETSLDKNGKIIVPEDIQMELIDNNLPRVTALAAQAANAGKNIELEQDKKKGFDQFFPEYYMKLADLARTYNAEKVPFGAYMNTLLPLKYAGILEDLKKGEIEGAVGLEKAADVAVENENIERAGNLIKLYERFGRYAEVYNLKVKEAIKDGKFNPAQENISRIGVNTVDVFPSMTQTMFGVIPKEGNLTKGDLLESQMFTNKHVETIIAMFPQTSHVVVKINEKTGKPSEIKSIGIPRKILKAFYNKGKRIGNDYMWTLKPDITAKNVLEFAGITERGKPNLYKKDTNTSQNHKALHDIIGRMMTNQAAREHFLENNMPLENMGTLQESMSGALFSKGVNGASLGDKAIFFAGLPKFGQNYMEHGKNVRKAFNMTYPPSLFKGNKKSIIEDLERYIELYGEYKTEAVLTGEIPLSLENYINEKTMQLELEDNLKALLNLPKGQLDFKNKDQLEEVRNAISTILYEGNISQEEAKRFLGFLYSTGTIGGTTLTVGKNGKLIPNEQFWQDKILKKQEQLEVAKAQKDKVKIAKHQKKILEYETNIVEEVKLLKSHPYGIFQNAEDFRKIVLEGLPTGGKIQANTKQDVTVDATSKKGQRAQEESTKRNKDFLIKFGDQMRKLESKGKISKNAMGMILLSMGNAGMNTPIAAAAKVAYTTSNPTIATHRYEHLIPRKRVTLHYANFVLEGTAESQKDLQGIFDDFVVAIIPKEQDNIINDVGYQSMMPASWIVGANPLQRYFNMRTFGKINLKLIDVKTGKPITGYESFQKVHEINGDNHAKSVIKNKAILAGRVVAPARGMSTFDFDETVGVSDNYVIAKKTFTKEEKKDIIQQEADRLSNLTYQDYTDIGGETAPNTDILGYRSAYSIANESTSEYESKKRAWENKYKEKKELREKKSKEFLESYDKSVAKVDEYIEDKSKLTYTEVENVGNPPNTDILGYRTAWSIANESTSEYEYNFRAWERKKNEIQESKEKKALESVKDQKFYKEMVELEKEAGVMETKKIPSEQWPFVGEQMIKEDWEMDFTDFNQVTKGRPGPLMQKLKNQIKKYGNENVFILTARAPESAPAIKAYLESEGVDLPIENITGLGNSTGAAKAEWMLEKFSEGYNDMYFVDDALPNVEAVKDVLDQLDIKSNVQQARQQFSKGIKSEFAGIMNNAMLDMNRILEQTKGVKAEAVFSAAQAKVRGGKIGRYKIFLPPSAQDFKGLLYHFLGKGRVGEAQMAFFDKALIKPFAKAISEINSFKQVLNNKYKAALKEFGVDLKNTVGDTKFTEDQAVRVYLWNKAGFEIPGLSKRDLKTLVEHVESNQNLQAFAETIGLASEQEAGYLEPSDYWMVENLQSDILKIANERKRSDFLGEWKQNVEIIFSPANLNKIEAIYGSNFREALEDMLHRMEHGTSRESGKSRIVNTFNNWANQSVGAIMFFNMRSALLQTISSINFINWSDNNPLKAAMAFANQPQFWKDFAMIFNSDMLKQRRAGNQRGINEAELADAVAGAKDIPRAVLNWLLTKGFLPTQIADSFAISSGGATFYRNRFNTYVEQGYSQEEAHDMAFQDFQENSEESQQSSRPDMISQQQASPLGRYILAFKNTPMQYARLIQKAAKDLVKGRGDARTNMSKIVYYAAVQNLIFNVLQGSIGMLIGDDDEEKDIKKYERTINGMIDSLLGGMGIGGVATVTLKNTIQEWLKQDAKDWNSDHTYTILRFFGLSPTISSKGRKLYSAIQTDKFNREVIEKMSLLDIDNPIYSVIGNIVSATTNLPLDRVVKKVDNIDAALTEDLSALQRLALLMGWNTWDLDVDDSDVLAVEDEVKKEKEVEKKKKQKIKKEEKKKERVKENKTKEEENRKKEDGGCIAISKGGTRCKNEAEVDGYCTVHAKVEQGTKEVQCKKIKSDKKRCGMMTKAKSGYCYYHD